MARNPTNLQQSFFSVFTNAVANTVTTTTLVNAPGANFRNRIWFWSASLGLSNVAANAFVVLRPAQLPRNTIALYREGQPSVGVEFPGGFPMVPNSVWQIDHSSQLASVSIWVMCLYTIEAV